MVDITHLRASSLPLAFLCPASVRPPALRIVQSNNAADLGTAVHEALRSLAETGRVDWDALPASAERHGANTDEMRALCAMGCRLWNSVSDSFQGAITEQELKAEVAPGVTLTGHADIMAISVTSIRVGDWKTGRKDADHSHQLRAYAALALLSSQGIEEATGTALWLRDGEIENYTLTRADADAWLRELRERVIDWSGAFYPGSHCRFCPRDHECEAANALTRRAIAAVANRELIERAECDLPTMPAEQIIDIYRKATLVEGYCDRVRKALREYVLANGDIVANGVRLTVTTEKRRKVIPIAAWPVLERNGFGDEELSQCVSVSVSKAEKVVAERAGRGKGAAAVRAFSAELEQAGAVEFDEIQKLQEKRK